MSCPNPDSPINITTTANVLSCQVFCSYMHQYKDSACTATYFPDHIKLSYDATTSAAVTFNNEGYNVREINIYAPSIHMYDGSPADAELLIIHDGAGKKLIVSIPLVQANGATTTSAKILDEIISKFSSTVDKTKTNDSQLINVHNYNMENFEEILKDINKWNSDHSSAGETPRGRSVRGIAIGMAIASRWARLQRFALIL